MKKILAALAITGLVVSGANAQTTRINVCGVKHDKVCRQSADKKSTSCYKTEFAQNFKVCKNQHGYYICCETPDHTNSTYGGVVAQDENRTVANQNQGWTSNNQNRPEVDMTIPQSQSYVMQSNNSYEGYYTDRNKNKRGRIKVCYIGDNVAANNRAPYEGCPSPQSDGPEVNNHRNMNVSNPVDLPPISGRPHE